MLGYTVAGRHSTAANQTQERRHSGVEVDVGELISEETGRTSSIRVLSSEGGETEVEISLQTQGTIQGVPQQSMWTYQSKTRADGTVLGGGVGVMTTADGDVIHMTGHGAAKSVGPDGSVKYRGAIFFNTASDKHAALNGSVGVFEYDVDADGSTSTRAWEWK